MTREEAIEVLAEDLKQRSDGYYSYLQHYGHRDDSEEKYLDALYMAIAALSEQVSPNSVVIPECVTSIGDYAFYECSGLTRATIPDSVASIGGCFGEHQRRPYPLYDGRGVGVVLGRVGRKAYLQGGNKMIKRSCEDKNTIYLCLFGRRYIFRDGKYIGWYKP